MTTKDKETFKESCTPEALKSILRLNSNNFAISITVDDLLGQLHADSDLVVDAAFFGSTRNAEAYSLLQQQADALMYLGYELHRCLMLWCTPNDHSATSDTEELRPKPTLGVVAFYDGRLSAVTDFCSIAEPSRLSEFKVAREFLRDMQRSFSD